MNDINRDQGTWAEPSQFAESNPAPQYTSQQPGASVSYTAGTSPAIQPPVAYGVIQNGGQHKETEETVKLKENYGFFGPITFIYSVFYAFCMYRNGSGVTFPFFVAGSLLLLCLFLSKLGTTLKKGSIFYMVGMILLGISTFLTDDARIIVFNKLGIFLLMMSLLLNQFFDTSKWKLGKYLGGIIQLIFMSIGEIARPVQDGINYRKARSGKDHKNVGFVIIGLMISVPLLSVVLVLLASADAVFFDMIVKVLGKINIVSIFQIGFLIVFMFFFSYMLTSYLCKKQIKEEVVDYRTGEPVLAITVTTMLTLVYLLFSVVQIAALFLGKMQLPQGYTYARYARQGFFQLLIVSILNLIIVLGCMNLFKKSMVLKGILTLMSLCTFIMIASSAMRMLIYIRFYYLTFLRILVLWGLALLAVLFAGILISIYAERFPLFRYSMVVVTLLYLALSFAHPDYIIAKVNIANVKAEGKQWWVAEGVEPYQDFRYLSRLSADAAPVIVPFLNELGYDFAAFDAELATSYANEQRKQNNAPWLYINYKEDFGYWWLERLQERTDNFGIRTFNLSRYRAMQMLH